MLHIINQSPFRATTWLNCLRFATRNDAILLIEDAVYAAISDFFITNLSTTPVTYYALIEDVNARGLAEKIANQVQQIDYAGFVDLTVNHTPIQTWAQ